MPRLRQYTFLRTGSLQALTGSVDGGSTPQSITIATHGTTLVSGSDTSSYTLSSRTFDAGKAYLLVCHPSGFNNDAQVSTPTNWTAIASTTSNVENAGDSRITHRIQIFARVFESEVTESTSLNIASGNASSMVAYTRSLTSDGDFDTAEMVVQTKEQILAASGTNLTITFDAGTHENNAFFTCATVSSTGTWDAQTGWTFGETNNPASPNAASGDQWRSSVDDVTAYMGDTNGGARIALGIELTAGGSGGGGGGGGGGDLEDILNNMVGYASYYNVNGGSGQELYHVTNNNNSGTGSLRAGAEAGNKWIVFDDNFDITLSSPIEPAANTTIDGRDENGNYKTIDIYGRGFWVINTANVIIHNIYIRQVLSADDGIQIRGSSSTAWVYQCSIGDSNYLINDGHCDITDDAKATVQECAFYDEQEAEGITDKAMLVGNSSDDTNTLVTVYRCFFEGINNRSPFAAGGKAHVVDTIVKDWSTFGAAGGRNGHLLVDGFMADKSGGHEDRAVVPWDANPRYVKVISFWGRQGGESYTEENASSVFTPPYSLGGNTPNQTLYNSVLASVGRQTA